MAPPHVALIGMPGSGKSTIARRLGEELELEPVDLDDLIAAAAGVDIPGIFASEGEAGFRTRERAALAELLEPDAPRRVVACGGGAVLAPENRDVLARRATTVLLAVVLDVLAERLAGEADGRPLLAGDVGDRLAALASERDDLYAAVADVSVDAGALDPDEVVGRIVEALA